MQRRYISSVTPLDGHVLQIDYVSGSRVMLDMTPLLESIRFRPLKRPEVWASATTNGIFVRFANDTAGSVELSHDELLSMAEEAYVS